MERRIVALVLAAAISAALSGCGGGKPAATTTPEDPAGATQCYANQEAIEEAVLRRMLEPDAPRMPMNYGQVQSLGFVSELLWCPAGGDMIWVPTEGGFMQCSIHGRWVDQPAHQ